jgi:hypothetical protein
MTQFNHTVNPDEQEDVFDIVPAGEYVAVIEESSIVANKQGTGEILKLTYQVIDGPFKGRKIFNNLNIKHSGSEKSAQTEAIARKSLNSICVAVGLQGTITDTTQLHDKPLKVDVKVSESAEYGKQNKIKKHSPVNDNGGNANQSTPPANSEATGGKKKQPWE